jgi:hypothetical protein
MFAPSARNMTSISFYFVPFSNTDFFMCTLVSVNTSWGEKFSTTKRFGRQSNCIVQRRMVRWSRKLWNEKDVWGRSHSQFKISFQHLPRGIHEIHKILRYPVSGPKFESGTSRLSYIHFIDSEQLSAHLSAIIFTLLQQNDHFMTSP